MYSTYSDCVMRVRPNVENNNGSDYSSTFTKFEGGKSCVTSPFLIVQADECTFTWKVFTSWDYGIANTEAAHNKVSAIVIGIRQRIQIIVQSSGSGRGYRSLFIVIGIRQRIQIIVHRHRDQADHCVFSHNFFGYIWKERRTTADYSIVYSVIIRGNSHKKQVFLLLYNTYTLIK